MAACTPVPTSTLFGTEAITTFSSIELTSTIFNGSSSTVTTIATTSPLVIESVFPTSTLFSTCPSTTSTPTSTTTTTPTPTSTPTTTANTTPTSPFSITITTPTASSGSTTTPAVISQTVTITASTSTPSSSASAQPDNGGNSSSGGSSNTGAIVGGVVGGIGGAAALFLLLFFLCCRKKKRADSPWGSKDGDSDFFSPVSGDAMREGGAATAGAGGIAYAAANRQSTSPTPKRSTSQTSRITTGSYEGPRTSGYSGGPSSYNSHSAYYGNQPSASQVSPSVYSQVGAETLAGAAGVGAGNAAARRPSQRTYGSDTAYNSHARTRSGGSADYADHRRSGSYGHEFAGYAIPEHSVATATPPANIRRHSPPERPVSPGAASVYSQPAFGALGGPLHITNRDNEDNASAYGGLTHGALARHDSVLRTTEAPLRSGTVARTAGPPSYTTQPRM